jgi:hypothetical protein
MNPRRLDSILISFPTNPCEYRDMMERRKLEKATLKQRTIAGLTAPQFDAQRRIRIWESLHGLNLPKSSSHELLSLIAKKTALTLDEVRREQIRRQAVLAAELRQKNALTVSEIT